MEKNISKKLKNFSENYLTLFKIIDITINSNRNVFL